MRPDSARSSPYDQPSAAGNVPEMLEDYRRRRETLETQARELAQLQQDMLKAAERESGAIVADTRARIASILGEARRDLAELAARVEAIAGPEEERRPLAPQSRDAGGPVARGPMADPNAVRESLRRARLEIGRLLKEAKPDIESAPTLLEARPPRSETAPARVETVPKRVEAPPTRIESAPRRAETASARVETAHARVESAPARVEPAPKPIEPPAAESESDSDSDSDSDEEAYRALQESLRRLPIEPAREIPTPPARPHFAEETRGIFSTPERLEWPPFRTEFDLNALRQSPQVRIVAFVVAALAVVLLIWWMQSSSPAPAGDATPRRDSVPAPSSSPAPTGRAEAPVKPTSAAAPERAGGPRPPATKDQPVAPPSSAAAGRVSAPPVPAPSSPGARGSPPGTAGSGAGDTASVSAELMTTAQRWLDAYSRRDTVAMQAVSARTMTMKVSDQRPATERLPASAEGVRRTLEDVSFQLVGETAIMTARLTEQGNVGGRSPHFLSWISLMWIRESGTWRLMDVQILSDSQLRQRPNR